MAKFNVKNIIGEIKVTTEWASYLVFLSAVALLYIYLLHRTDNFVRDIEKTKKNLVELRAENITLKTEIMKNRSRQNMEYRLVSRSVKEPNKAIKVLVKANAD